MSSRKKTRRARRPERPLLDELFGAHAARRLRLLAILSIAALFVGGCALFLFESQTIGRVLFVLGLAWALLWLGLRYAARKGDVFEAIHRRRRSLVCVSAGLIGAGWVVFFAVWEELGLLLVILGAVPLAIVIGNLRRAPPLSPIDGPPYGETGPT